jgi:hypothetical protein
LTLAVTHPLVWHLTTQVPHDLGDPILSATLLWWNAHTTPLTARWWDAFFFFPAGGAVAFSDHRLGASLIASPLLWAGVSTIGAYNIALLATFPLCAVAAHWLAVTVTDRHDAGLVAGLAFGFNPYRLAHLEHLELLAAFGMPAALAALHLYARDRRPRWAVVFALALAVQALSCSYYFLFFLVLLAMWSAWFLRRGDGAVLAGVAIATGFVVALFAPIAWSYRSIHAHYGFTRTLDAIVTLSADVTSYVTASPMLALWGWTAPLNGPERQLFPGAVLIVLVGAGAIASLRTPGPPPQSAAWRRASLILACVFAAVAAATGWLGPWQLGSGPLSVSAATVFKPLSLACACLVAAFATTPRVRAAFARRSAFAFYLLAAAVLSVCSLGPKPAFLGRQVLYEPPYAWLMRVSLFGESVRVPARFGMLVTLALSIAGAIAFSRLVRPRARPAVLAAVAILVVLDGWVMALPLVDPPAPWSIRVPDTVTAFVELPLGETVRDTAAMYRATLAALPTANGYSGYEPPHYEALRQALEDRDETAFDALATHGPLLVVVDRHAAAAGERTNWLAALPRAHAIGEDDGHAYYVVEPAGAVERRACGAMPIPIVSATYDGSPIDLRPITDDDGETFWKAESQRAGDAIEIDLGRPVVGCSIELSLGWRAGLFPRNLSVATSRDRAAWQTVFSGKTGGQTVLAAVQSPKNVPLVFALDGTPTRFIRLRLQADRLGLPWLVSRLTVTGALLE